MEKRNFVSIPSDLRGYSDRSSKPTDYILMTGRLNPL